MSTDIVDVVIIGGGPGGYAAAIKAAQLGGKVTLVEKNELGGVCLNRGCIPVKALLKSAKLLSEINNAENFGIVVNNVSINFKTMMEKVSAIVKRLATGLNYLIKANGIQMVKGTGRIIDPSKVEILKENNERVIVKCKNIVIATGSVPTKVAIPGIDEMGVITTDEALQLEEVPKSILIVGGNTTGVNFAYIFNAFGAKVTVVEPTPNLFPSEDKEIAVQLERMMKKGGVNIITNAKITGIGSDEEGNKVAFVDVEGGKREIRVEKVLLTSRTPNTGGLGLEKIGVKVHEGRVVVNNRMETSVPGVYAVGDVRGGTLAHTALEEGIVAAENAMGMESTISYKAVPRCTFTIPQVASVGLTEEQVKERSYDYKVGRFPFIASGGASAIRETRGFIKMIAEAKTGEILGVHIIGPEAAHLIAEATLAINLEATTEEIVSTLHAHPTLSEALKEAALDVDGRAIHKA